MDDLRSSLTRAGFRDFKIERRAARILVRAVSDPERAALVLGKIFGVAYAAPVDIVPGRVDDVLQAVVKNADKSLTRGESFAIRSRHSKISQLPRREIETRGGAEILRQLADREVVVNLDEPDVLISVDTADDLALIYRNRIPGPGGLPLSSRWKMVVVLDSGFFSILAAFAMMRRGCLVEPFIPTSRRASKFAKETQLALARMLGKLVPRSQYFGHVIDLDAVPKPGISEISLDRVRMMAAQFAITRFRGIIFADVCGDISKVSKNRYSMPTFYPLVGLEFEELNSLCDVVGISKQELRSKLAAEGEDLNGASELTCDFVGDIIIDKIPLGLATEIHDHIAC
jgi:adenylyl- and sulfurtransferase ThiI